MGHKRLIREKKKMTEQTKPLKSFLCIVLAILTAIGTIIAIMLGVNELIDRRIEDEQFIRKVAANIRPYVIFDVNESILVDGGAMQTLEQIKVEKGIKDGGNIFSVKIIVTPKYHLAHSPLIEKVGAGRIILTPNPIRGPGHQWIYEFEVIHWEEDKTPLCFRLEIVR